MRAGELFGALRERQFRLLWLGQATSTLGDGLVPVALAFAVIKTLDRGRDGARRRHRRPDSARSSSSSSPEGSGPTGCRGRWSCSLPTSSAASCRRLWPSCCSSGAAELWHLVVLDGDLRDRAGVLPARRDRPRAGDVSPERLQQANALLGLSRSLAFVIGPAVAGVIAAATNPGIVFVVDAATFTVSATSLALLRLSRSRRRASARASSPTSRAAGTSSSRTRGSG